MSKLTLALCLLSSLAVTPALAQSVAPQEPVIVTHGEATVKRAPDRAWITISTEVRDAKGPEARRKSAEIMTSVQNALKPVGLAADALRTTAFSLTPEMEYVAGVGRVKGYVVRNQIEVRVDDLEKLSDVVDAANAPKNAGLSVIGPRFDLKNRQAAEHDVLRLAVEAAMGRAQAMASGARRTLGPIVRVEEQMAQDFPRPMSMTAARGAMEKIETPIIPGEMEVRANVILTIGIR